MFCENIAENTPNAFRQAHSTENVQNHILGENS